MKTELSPTTVTSLVVEESMRIVKKLIMRTVMKMCMLIMMRAMGMTMITSAHWRHTSIALPRSLQERKLRI